MPLLVVPVRRARSARPGARPRATTGDRSGPTVAARWCGAVTGVGRCDRWAPVGQNADMSVAIIMGSSSDASVMDDAVQTLRSFGVPVEVRVLSAHRTPDDTIAFARAAAANGVKVIIAAAGGAAHLAGVVAAATPLP